MFEKTPDQKGDFHRLLYDEGKWTYIWLLLVSGVLLLLAMSMIGAGDAEASAKSRSKRLWTMRCGNSLDANA
jgi:hypothetical protein